MERARRARRARRGGGGGGGRRRRRRRRPRRRVLRFDAPSLSGRAARWPNNAFWSFVRLLSEVRAGAGEGLRPEVWSTGAGGAYASGAAGVSDRFQGAFWYLHELRHTAALGHESCRQALVGGWCARARGGGAVSGKREEGRFSESRLDVALPRPAPPPAGTGCRAPAGRRRGAARALAPRPTWATRLWKELMGRRVLAPRLGARRAAVARARARRRAAARTRARSRTATRRSTAARRARRRGRAGAPAAPDATLLVVNAGVDAVRVALQTSSAARRRAPSVASSPARRGGRG